jgi:sugar phosphate isomerase/epimerase
MMKLGAYTACLHDKPVAEALATLRDLGLESAEINSGGFLPPVHLPVDDIRASKDAREEYLGLFASAGLALTALNCNGNPLDPNPEVGPRHAQDIRDSIEVAATLGVKRVVTMSGLPGSDPGARYPSWTVEPWHSVFLDARDYQWNEVGIPFWKDIQARAADADVKVCIEMHPHNLVYNPATMERLATEINATHVGAEMDPSHLFWQGIDPVAACERLGGLVYNAAAKDTRINPAARINGVLNDVGFTRPDPNAPGVVPLGGPYVLSQWPKAGSWDFVAVGRGHDVDFWRDFLAALEKVDPDMAVNIEHEDQELGQLEGLRFAAATLVEASRPPQNPADPRRSVQ